MDRTLQKYLGAIHARVQEHLNGLGDYPKENQFEHGVQVGAYRGLQEAIGLLEQVINDEVQEDSRR